MAWDKHTEISIINRVEALVARYCQIPYTNVLKEYELTPQQFFLAANRDLEYIIMKASELGVERYKIEILETIEDDKNLNWNSIINRAYTIYGKADSDLIENIKKYIEMLESARSLNDSERYLFDNEGNIISTYVQLFDMGEEFIIEQYEAVFNGHHEKLPRGIHINPLNTESLVYYVLTKNNPELNSSDHSKAVSIIKGLPKEKEKYFTELCLYGVLNSAFDKGEKDSPLALLEAFDRKYMKKTGNPSLFDLSQPDHLHKWGADMIAPNYYWSDPNNIKEATWHIISELNPNFISDNRDEVIQLFSTPSSIKFRDSKFSGVIKNEYKSHKGYRAIMHAFDDAYQEKTGNPSLFDPSQDIHLLFDRTYLKSNK